MRKYRLVSALVAVLAILASLRLAMPANADVSSVYGRLTVTGGLPLMNGTSIDWTAPSFSASIVNPNYSGEIPGSDISVDFNDGTYTHIASVWISSPDKKPLQPGIYEAQRAPFQPAGMMGFDFDAEHNGCNTSYSSVTIHKVVIDAGQVTRLKASFVQHCDAPDGPAVEGSIDISSDPAFVSTSGGAPTSPATKTPTVNSSSTTSAITTTSSTTSSPSGITSPSRVTSSSKTETRSSQSAAARAETTATAPPGRAVAVSPSAVRRTSAGPATQTPRPPAITASSAHTPGTPSLPNAVSPSPIPPPPSPSGGHASGPLPSSETRTSLNASNADPGPSAVPGGGGSEPSQARGIPVLTDDDTALLVAPAGVLVTCVGIGAALVVRRRP